MLNINLNRYTDDYYEFVYEVKKKAYKSYVEECWGDWDENAQKQYFKKFIDTYKDGCCIIELDWKSIGFYNGHMIDKYTY